MVPWTTKHVPYIANQQTDGNKSVTVVVRGLPRSTEAHLIKHHFRAISPVIANPVVRSITSHSGRQDDSMTAIVTFEAPTSKDREKATAKLHGSLYLGLDKITLNVQEEFLGLTPIFEHKNPDCDIYFVHGLGGHAFRTWTSDANESPAMWPQDFLPERFEQRKIRVRISTLGYTANVRGDVSPNDTLENAASSLLSRIAADRPKDSKRPIFFVCHSLGGLVVCQALILALLSDGPGSAVDQKRRDLLWKTGPVNQCLVKGICFFGTPFQGSEAANFLYPYVNVLAKLYPSPVNAKLVESLKDRSLKLLKIVGQFEQVRKEMDIGLMICYERFPTVKGTDLVTTKESAVSAFGQNTIPIEINASHSHIVKFADRHGDTFSLVATNLVELVEDKLRPSAPGLPSSNSPMPGQQSSYRDHGRNTSESSNGSGERPYFQGNQTRGLNFVPDSGHQQQGNDRYNELLDAQMQGWMNNTLPLHLRNDHTGAQQQGPAPNMTQHNQVTGDFAANTGSPPHRSTNFPPQPDGMQPVGIPASGPGRSQSVRYSPNTQNASFARASQQSPTVGVARSRTDYLPEVASEVGARGAQQPYHHNSDPAVGSSNTLIQNPTSRNQISSEHRNPVARRAPRAENQFEDNSLFVNLKLFDTVFLIDDSGSMQQTDQGSTKSRWDILREALGYIGEIAAGYDPDGVEVYFICNSDKHGDHLHSKQSILDLLDQVDPGADGAAEGTQMSQIMESLLDSYLGKYRRYRAMSAVEQAADRLRCYNLIVITDGEADDKEYVQDTLAIVARELDDFRAPRAPARQVGVQFLQVGTDEGAAKWLKLLDDQLPQLDKVRDMVDTRPYVSNEDDLSGLDFQMKLRKILLGAVTRDIDRQ
ncbi:MAG: hypothetical protein M4579_005970 [Chaenotheca gracillima]|nr:MAG: hypothetical protein M4579_005970 [Chaenotheca gracillima]